jgi:hypothetical protein
MAEHKIIQQDGPDPVCVSVNKFSGVVLAKGTGRTAAAATKAARELAKTKRDEAIAAARGKKCPPGCQDGSSSKIKKANREIGKHQDGNTFVSYCAGDWEVTRICKGKKKAKPPALPTTADPILISHTADDPACGKTRVFSGCVVAMGQGRNPAAARANANRAAKDKAIAASFAISSTKRCPDGCKGKATSTAAVAMPVKIRNVKVWQAKGRPTVSYAYVFWTVEIKC